MSFWENLKNFNGKAQFFICFQFAGEVGTEGGHIGGLDIHTYCDPATGLVTLEKDYSAKPGFVEKKHAYVLSWKHDAITEVTFQTLSGYDYFMTSRLSGCRFVVTSDSVSHIACFAGGDRSKSLQSQEARDNAEVASMKAVPKWRRRLSISGTTGIVDAAYLLLGLDNQAASYDVHSDFVMMFGYKENSVWHFKMLKSPKNFSHFGEWSIFI